MPAERLIIQGEVPLEAALHQPAGTPARGGVVVCHPHPLYGGDMDNHLVVAVARAAAEKGLFALRFNFRGTGGSGGRYGGGDAERRDVGAALRYLAQRIGPAEPLALAGYSFGAHVALAYVAGPRQEGEPLPRALALLALPVRMSAPAPADVETVAELGLRVLAVAGEADDLCPPAALRAMLAPLGAAAALLTLPGADHGYWGFAEQVGAAVAGFLAASQRDRPGAEAGR